MEIEKVEEAGSEKRLTTMQTAEKIENALNSVGYKIESLKTKGCYLNMKLLPIDRYPLILTLGKKG